MSRRKGLNFRKKKKKISTTLLKEIGSYIFIIAVSILMAFVIVWSVGMRTRVIGTSMESALYNGQEILVNRFVYKLFAPKQEDIIVFRPNGNQNSHYYVKRVVAVSGDTVQIKDGILYVNEEPYGTEMYDKIADAGMLENAITLESEEYCVLGDNINSSEDSRSGNIGMVKRDDIVGKVWFHMAAENVGVGLMK
jgi:signal peptidase I